MLFELSWVLLFFCGLLWVFLVCFLFGWVLFVSVVFGCLAFFLFGFWRGCLFVDWLVVFWVIFGLGRCS